MPGRSRNTGGRRRPGRVAKSLAAPAVAGLCAALGSILVTATTDLLDDRLSKPVQVLLVALASVLLGLTTWATSRQQREEGRARDGAPAPSQLPPIIAHFTGRDEVLAELHRWFASHRRRDPGTSSVLTIYGRGGVGKSALATRFAHEISGHFPDGRLYFDLSGGVGESGAPIRPEEVLAGFLRALGVRLTTDPGGLRELQTLWRTWTSNRKILIFLDNAQSTEQVQDLVPPEPGCAVIVTSRRPLFLRNHHDIRLDVFTEEQGVELLRRLAGEERIDADRESARAIVRLCDRLPLAISICGGRLATRPGWTPRDLADRLRDERHRLDHLEVGRQVDTSVRASVQLSYDACTELQRRLLRMLGLLTVPDVSAWAAGALLDTSELDGADQLEALVDAQLAESSGSDVTGQTRYRLHDLVRLYAREQALRTDPLPVRRAAIERFLSGYRRRAEAYATARWPQDWSRSGVRRRPAGAAAGQPAASDWFAAEWLSLLAAVHLAREQRMWEQAWRIGRAYCSLCHSMRAFWADWQGVAEITCAAATELGDERAIGIALLERATAAGNYGNAAHARADAERALEIFNRLGETWWAARAMRTIGMTYFNAGDLDQGQTHLLEAIAAFHALDDPWWRARTQRNLAELRLAQHEHDSARKLVEQALAVFQRNGNRYSEAQTQRVLGEVLAAEARALRERGEDREANARFALAESALQSAIQAFHDRQETWEEARALRAAGSVGNPANLLQEHRHVQHAKEMLERLGDSWGVARSEYAEGHALHRRGRLPAAIDALRRVADRFAELGDRWWQARSLRTLAAFLLEAGRAAEARDTAAKALEIYTGIGNAGGIARTREVLDRAEAALGGRRDGRSPHRRRGTNRPGEGEASGDAVEQGS